MAMWNVKDGRLYWDRDPVAVRRAVVELVNGRAAGPVGEDRVRHMLRMERALSIREISASSGAGEQAP
jgi:hypothetical protein